MVTAIDQCMMLHAPACRYDSMTTSNIAKLRALLSEVVRGSKISDPERTVIYEGTCMHYHTYV
jgi:hypothetical protein